MSRRHGRRNASEKAKRRRKSEGRLWRRVVAHEIGCAPAEETGPGGYFEPEEARQVRQECRAEFTKASYTQGFREAVASKLAPAERLVEPLLVLKAAREKPRVDEQREPEKAARAASAGQLAHLDRMRSKERRGQ